MVKKQTDDEICAMIRYHCLNAAQITELPGGLLHSQIYVFEADGLRYVFKTGTRKEEHRKEQWVSNRYHEVLPLRQVVQIYGQEDQSSYAIYRFIEGDMLVDLESQELIDTIPSVLDTLSILRSIKVNEGEGYGRFDEYGNAPYPSWLDYVEAIYNDQIYNWSEAEQKGLDLELVEDAIKQLKHGAGSIKLKSRCLVHGDLGSYSIIAKQHRVTGLIDWKLAMYGDHLYDIANLMFWNEDRLDSLNAKLQAEYMTTVDNRNAILCYMLRIGLEELYTTVMMNEPGCDIEWVANRLRSIAGEIAMLG